MFAVIFVYLMGHFSNIHEDFFSLGFVKHSLNMQL